MKHLTKDLKEIGQLDPKIKEKAIEIAIHLINDKKMQEEEALKEGVKQAKEWFIDLEG